MNQLSKIIITIAAVVVFFLLFAVVVGTRESSGHSTPGIFGLILFAGLIGALRAVWKKDKNDDNKNDNNTSILQK